jgi:multimeric flavodoxin WrbA
MLSIVTESARKKGAEADIVMLKDLNIAHCKGCYDCEKSPYACVINDDMKGLMDRMAAADAITLGSPTFFDNVSGIMKDFIDRTLPIYNSKGLKGKKIGVCVIGGAGKEDISSIKSAAKSLAGYASLMEAELVKTVIVTESSPENSRKKLESLGRAVSK